MSTIFKPIHKQGKTFDINPEIWSELRQFARNKGWYLSSTVERIISNYLEEQKSIEKQRQLQREAVDE